VAAAADVRFAGNARDVQTGELLYRELHAIRGLGTPEEERVVLYQCSRGEAVFARKRLVYPASRENPEFEFEDARLGYLEGLRRVGAGREVYQRPSANVPLRRRSVPSGVAIVSDAGFDEFVRNHWAELETGRTVRFPFLVPSRLDYLTFKVKKHGEGTIEDEPVSLIRLNLSGLLGFFLPYIEVSYRKSDRVLARYVGLTNIRDLEGANVTARIDFPAQDRIAGPVDLEAALARPLVARCP
jgi:hypothetical protein